jgi:hypothetical protein
MAWPCNGIANQGHAYHKGDPQSPSMNRNECAYAAQHFLTFLKQVGPIEAAWAMNTVLPTLMELPPGHDHVAAAQTALEESLKEFDDLAQVASSEPAEGDGEALLAEASTPAAPVKKPGGKAS